MLTRLRREYVAIVMVLVGIVLAAVLGSSLVSSYLSEHALTFAQLERAIENVGNVPQIGDESGGVGTSVTVTVDVTVDGELVSGHGTDYGTQLVWIDEGTLDDLIEEVLASADTSGESSTYSVAWLRVEISEGYRIAFIDVLSRDSSFRTQLINDIVIFLVAMAALFVAAQLLSRWVLYPVEQAWDKQRRFVSDASHELKTPLAVILANMQIVDADESVPEDVRRWVSSTLDEASHMKALVEDLLTLARADECEATGAPQGAPESQDVNLTKVVSGCALEFDAVAFERGCSIECELEPDVIVTGNPERIGRVVRTLLDNATKYADKGTTVLVRLTREQDGCCFTVNNRGEVISPENIEHLFDRFFRTDHARERQATGGFGLGLAIAKSIVESSGGSIGVTSTEAEGTTFCVRL